MPQTIPTDIAEDVETFRRFFTERLPDASCRYAVLSLLADSIFEAQRYGGDRWMLSFDGRHVRLYVGRHHILEIGHGYLWLAFESGELSPKALAKLKRLRAWKKPQFKDLPSSAGGAIRCIEMNEGLKLAREPYLGFLRAAAQEQPVRADVRGAYAGGAIAYLHSALESDLPEPEVAIGIPTVDEATLALAFWEFDASRRNTNAWQNWESNPSYRYMAVWKDQRYPVKEVVRIATGAQGFTSTQARDYLASHGIEIVTLHRTPQTWIFQAKARRLSERAYKAQPGDIEEWSITHDAEQMQPGDRVLLWQAGEAAGIYALASIVEAPEQRAPATSEKPRWLTAHRKQVETEWRVQIRYERTLSEPLLKAELQQQPTLHHLKVLRTSTDSHFLITKSEWALLEALINGKEAAPSEASQTAESGDGNVYPQTPINEAHALAEEPQASWGEQRKRKRRRKTELKSFAGLLDRIRAEGLSFPVELVSEYLLALQVKRFVILTGISGTGKTRLAMTTARYYADTPPTEPAHNYEVIAVHPDWVDQRGLIGFYNPLTRDYVTTPFLRFLLAAAAEEQQARAEQRPAQPHFAILDEMNLARVEYYFADFLSCLESGTPLVLHDDIRIEQASDEHVAIPRRLAIPGNLFFTGTVNIDETTAIFSPKVLDRAFTIELNQVDLVSFGTTAPADEQHDPLYLRHLPERILDAVSVDAARDTEWIAFGKLEDGALRQMVERLNEELETEQRQFGYRVAHELARFVNLAAQQAGSTPATLWGALDLAILAKVLPRLSGTQQELGTLLTHLFEIVVHLDKSAQPSSTDISTRWQVVHGRIVLVGTQADTTPVYLPRSAARIWLMLRRLQRQGFTAFLG